MRRRILQAAGVASAAVLGIVLLKGASATVATQDQAIDVAGAASTARPAPKTPWGEPDLQGLWTAEFTTPLQRPARYASKEFFTDEERAELDRLRAELIGADRRSERGSEQDVGGAYSIAIFTSQKRLGRRTSMIVDPPDGRIPPLTPEAKNRQDETRAFQLALLQPTAVCKNKRPECAGGTYGPPSPRRAEAAPHYLATLASGGGVINRADGPEDRGVHERCLAATLPDLAESDEAWGARPGAR